MQIRTSCPNNNNYYIRQANGGWNGAIQGKPTKSGANVLSNCVGYANGRFAEIMGQNKVPYQLVCNAENFIEKAKNHGLTVVNYPTLGGIMVWQKGTLSSGDGAGHVAIVERIDNANQIYTSESSYSGSAFYNAIRSNNNGRWGMGSAYTFRGCIVNPTIGDIHYIEPVNNYNVNTTYTTQVDLKIRAGAGIDKDWKLTSQLTSDGKKHAYNQTYAVLKSETRVTCQEIKQVGNDIWIRIPSGWIAAKYQGKIYVK